MSLPKLPSCEAVGWIKTAALREALDSLLLEAYSLLAYFSLPLSVVCSSFSGKERSSPSVATVWHCLASEGPCLRQGQAAALILAAPLPHIPQPGGREQLFSQGMCASAYVSFWGSESKFVIASLVPSLPALALEKAEASRVPPFVLTAVLCR